MCGHISVREEGICENAQATRRGVQERQFGPTQMRAATRCQACAQNAFEELPRVPQLSSLAVGLGSADSTGVRYLGYIPFSFILVVRLILSSDSFWEIHICFWQS